MNALALVLHVILVMTLYSKDSGLVKAGRVILREQTTLKVYFLFSQYLWLVQVTL